MEISKNKKVILIEKTFGIKLPEFKMYVSKKKVESEVKEEGGVLHPSKWKFEGGPYIPEELEKYVDQSRQLYS